MLLNIYSTCMYIVFNFLCFEGGEYHDLQTNTEQNAVTLLHINWVDLILIKSFI